MTPDATHTGDPPHTRDFDAFVAANGRRLLHIARLIAGDDHRGEDLLQTALARTYLRWHRIQRDDPVAYVRRALVNGQRDWWRRKPSHERPAAYPPDRASDVDLAEEHARRDALLRALAGLTRRERAVIVLRFYEDLPETEIAETLGIAPGTVKSTAARALRKLRESPDLASAELAHLAKANT
ncbi:SigE family RNA polymerase sigma factor [Yinghuangia seranimata]|uniref:SigE family RNA polymerase sigma factor n=1 Tax=Yinghuangia seranimata TaxID=408067 RepID=UPI00248B53E8|nr:SigE family RNA polymerase sigma factor [Yinghuangia seranimata]MDI2125714.1 SigE family RNA polymerase sigma factor [Yinghuangia seranimata]